MVRRPAKRRGSHRAEHDAADDREEQRPRRRRGVDRAGRHDRRGDAHEDERRSVVDEALTFHDRCEAMRDARASEREEDADRVRDREDRTEEQRGRERQPERVRRHRSGRNERDHDARNREGEDRPPRFAEAVVVGEERALEDEHRKERDEDDLGVHRRVRKHVREARSRPITTSATLYGMLTRFAPIATATPTPKTRTKLSSASRIAKGRSSRRGAQARADTASRTRRSSSPASGGGSTR